MHTCIPSHELKRSWHLCPRRVNVGNKNTRSMSHPRTRNVTTSIVEIKTVTYAKISPKMVNPRDLAENAEEEAVERPVNTYSYFKATNTKKSCKILCRIPFPACVCHNHGAESSMTGERLYPQSATWRLPGRCGTTEDTPLSNWHALLAFRLPVQCILT